MRVSLTMPVLRLRLGDEAVRVSLTMPVLGLGHGEEAERGDAVHHPGGGRRPHLSPAPDDGGGFVRRGARVVQDVLGAQRLVRARCGVVGRRAHRLRDVAVRLGLAAQQLAPGVPEQPQQLLLGRGAEGAQQEEEAAVEERRELGPIENQ